MAELRLRKRGKTWQYSFEGAKIGGKRKEISKGGFKTKAEATEAGTAAMNEYNNSGITFTPSEMSFSDFLDYWMKEYCELYNKESTIKGYGKRIRNHIKPALGAYKLSSLSPAAMQQFINDLVKQGYSRNSISVTKGIITKSLDFAVTQNLLRNNPAKNIRMPLSQNEKIKLRTAPHSYINKDEIEKILERFPEGSSAHLPIVIGYNCGLRLGEVYALTWDCVDLDNGKITINKQVQWNEKAARWYISSPKYNSNRTIEIDNNLKNLLLREKDKQIAAKVYYDDRYSQQLVNDDGEINSENEGVPIELVMTREDGTYINPRTIHHASQIIHDKLGIKGFTFHSLRHTHATILTENGAPSKYISYRLGHKTTQITEDVYTHASEKIIAIGDDILNDIYG